MKASKPLLHILWDDSQIWGLLAARAARDMSLPFRLVLGRDVASGLFERERPSLLLVPGGNARHKTEKLGLTGRRAIQAYVKNGGRYLGFCGGAGLALTGRETNGGLSLCPWQRAAFDDRMQHFMSGHLHMSVPSASGEKTGLVPEHMPIFPSLPVWWPGRFAPQKKSNVTVLASYEYPAEDFWLADLAIADLPPDTFAAWRDLYGLSFTPSFLAGQPCVVHGTYGKGDYILSYSHLETPHSPHANAWLAHLFRILGGLNPSRDLLPAWKFTKGESPWQDRELDYFEKLLEKILQTGLRHGLLFARTDWLMGWRTGIPGAALNNLWSALQMIREMEPCNNSLALWRERKESLLAMASLFNRGCTQYLLAERLAMTLAKNLPDTVPPAFLKKQRENLFGSPMHPSGLYHDLMEFLENLAFFQLSSNSSLVPNNTGIC